MALTNKDIEKLKTIFATKEDLFGFATKEDLARFATKEDLSRFATKEDLARFVTKAEFAELKANVQDLNTGFQVLNNRMLINFDAVFKELQSIRQELVSFLGLYRRHDEQLINHEGRIAKLEVAPA
jgi:hypothetical protein